MDIKILDSWLRDHLKTEAKPNEIAKALSLTSASIEQIEPWNSHDFIYHVEVTTNRPDMASIIGLAREAAAVLPRFEIPATFIPAQAVKPHNTSLQKEQIDIKNDDTLVRRVCAVILEVEMHESPQFMKDRLEASGTRSLNNLIDITNYVMHEIGHPTHAFDFDRLTTKKLIIRPSQKGETIVTLDKKKHTLLGGDIVADNGEGEIIDLLGVMGTENSVITNSTKRVLFFIDNNDPQRIRKTSMSLAIRTEAAGLNEKDVDPELAMPALLRGIELYQQYANAKVISDIFDIYPKKLKPKVVTVTKSKISQVIGIAIPIQQSINILQILGFTIKELKDTLEVSVPSWRNKDITIEEDVIEEIARVFGYHNIPSELPSFTIATPFHQETNQFFWEDRVKDAMKYWGFNETYTYSMVSEKLYEGPLEEAVIIDNPLDTDHIYMRKTVLPSLLEVARENAGKEKIKLFEIANVYHKKQFDLPNEVLTFAALWKQDGISFYHLKGIVEQLAKDCGIQNLQFKDLTKGGVGADIYIGNDFLGNIEVLESNMVSFELNFVIFQKHSTLKKVFTPIPKFPPVIEDLALIIDPSVKTGDIIKEIKKQSDLITSVDLLDQFENSRTFHIIYQNQNQNLTDLEIESIREKIITSVSQTFQARVKS